MPKRLLQITALLLCLCVLPWPAWAVEGENTGAEGLPRYENNFEGENPLTGLDTVPSANHDYNSGQVSQVVEDDIEGSEHRKVWKISNGGNVAGGRMYACRYSAGYGDQTLRFDLRTNSIADDKAPFVSVRRMNNDGNEMEGYAVHLYNDGTLIGKGYDADKAGNKVALPAGMEARGTDWHSYEINVNGYAITVKRDGQEIASWTDTTEAMVARKLRNNAIKKFPKDMNSMANHSLLQLDEGYKASREKITEHENSEPFEVDEGEVVDSEAVEVEPDFVKESE